MIAKVCLLTLLCVLSISARFHHESKDGMYGKEMKGGPGGKGKPPMGKCGPHGMAASEDVSDYESLFRSHLDASEDLTDCESASVINQVWCKARICIAQVKCNGNTKYAQFNISRFQNQDDLESAPEPAKEGMTGGYQKSDKTCKKLIGYMYHLTKGECHIKHTECMYQMRAGKKHYCPAQCGDKVRHLSVYEPLAPTVTLEKVSDELECFDKLTNSYLTDLVKTSTDNTFIFLEDHCHFPKGTKDTLVVTGGSYVDLMTGTQHCVTVQDKDQTVTLAVYKYNQPRTSPFLVAHPFGKMDDCKDFIVQIVRMWASKARMQGMKSNGHHE